MRVVRVIIPYRYQNLLNYLASGRWKDADEETSKQMLRLIGKNSWVLVERSDIDNFPCEDLCTLDQLWVQYSNGKFGFSVQKNIWLEVGGKVDMIRSEKELADRVGWRKGGNWLGENDLIFELGDTTPVAHLPSLRVRSSNEGFRGSAIAQKSEVFNNKVISKVQVNWLKD